MAFANSAISDIIATNIQSRSGELADNVTNNNALLRRLKDRGNIKTFSGGNVILQEIMYNDATSNNTNSYSGYEVLNVSQVQLIEDVGAAVTASVAKADGEKCERCWHWETDVGKNAEHPTLCGRCVEAVRQSHTYSQP